MNKVFEFNSLIKSAERDEEGYLSIEGMASTNDVDRAGDVIESSAWEGGLEDFKKNPIILFNHNYNEPIGKATKLEITDKGLKISAKISKAAGKIANLIEEGILSTFSVGFIVEDAKYNEKQDTFHITKAKLIENSVVSVPCNQNAVFSVAKSLDDETDLQKFKSKFTDTGPEEVSTSDSAPVSSAADSAKEEKVKMDPKELEKLVREIADSTARESAATALKMQEAERKAAEEKAAKEAEAAARIQELEVGKSGAEKALEELREELAKREADEAKQEELLKELKEQNEELTKMREARSSHSFSDRYDHVDVKSWAKENSEDLVTAHMIGVVSGKRIDETDFGKQLFEKAGIQYTTNAPDLDQEIQERILKEITVFTRVADLFREVNVNGASTIMPFQTDTNLASWAIDAAPDGNLENRTQVAANEFHASQVTLNAFRLVSASFIHNDTDEQVLVNLMPMMVEGVARAHARAVESQLLNGAANPFDGLDTFAPAVTPGSGALSAAAPGTVTAADLLGMRAGMGKFGLNPDEVTYIVNQAEYYSLLQDGAFANLNEVGEMATKIKGLVGAVYGSPVIVSDEFPAVANGAPAVFAVATRNYLIPRLRGVTVEQDYEVMNQRRVIVASQSLGFTEIQPGNGSTFEPVVKFDYGA